MMNILENVTQMTPIITTIRIKNKLEKEVQECFRR